MLEVLSPVPNGFCFLMLFKLNESNFDVFGRRDPIEIERGLRRLASF